MTGRGVAEVADEIGMGGAERAATVLERRYRWALRWYPRQYREEYEEEMVAVLMADGVPGRRWPRPVAVVDLVVGGVRAWLRRAARPGRTGPWWDAAAVVGLLVPVVLLVHLVAGAVELARFWSWQHGTQIEFGVQVGAPLVWTAVLVAVLAGRPRAAAWLAAGAAVTQLAVYLVMAFRGWGQSPAGDLLAAFGAVALAVRPPAGRAVQLLGRRWWVLAALLVLLALAATVPVRYAYAAGVVLLALVLRRVGLVVGLRVVALLVPAAAGWLGLPSVVDSTGPLPRLVLGAVLGAVVFGVAAAACTVLAPAGRVRAGTSAERA